MQFVQYECIKSELKDEYDKKMTFLHKRLNKKAQQDPSFFLMNSMTEDAPGILSRSEGMSFHNSADI